MATKQQLEAKNPLILRCNRLMEAFAKSDDERDFYLDRLEGFIIYVDLDKPEEELRILEKELEKHADRYCMIPKLTFYETKKIMEGFINEKVYDIDTKEKLLDIIQSKEARENFLEFIYDHHSELEKWQTYYQERSRIRIIEWLRSNNFHFVFEEDLDFPRLLLEKLKKELFETKVGKDIQNARKALFTKAKTYYSNEALNPRPKRGRPPKQTQKAEIEPQITTDIYTTVPNGLRGFLFTPDLTSASSATFSSKFGTEGDLFTSRRISSSDNDLSMENLNQKLEAIRSLSNKWREAEESKIKQKLSHALVDVKDFDEDEDEEIEAVGITAKPKSINGFTIPKKIVAPPAKAKPPIQKSAKPLPKKPVAQNAPKKIVSPAKKPLATKKKLAEKPKAKPAPKAKKPVSKPKVKQQPANKAKTVTKKPLRKSIQRPVKKLKSKKKR